MLARDMKYSQVDAMVQEEGIPFVRIELIGKCGGTTHHCSYPHDTSFWRTTAKPGDLVSYNGGDFFVIASDFVEGNATRKDYHGLILVNDYQLRNY